MKTRAEQGTYLKSFILLGLLWAGGAGLYYWQFINDPLRIIINFREGMTFDYPTAVPALKWLLVAAAGAPLVYLLAFFTPLRRWAPPIYLAAATVAAWWRLGRLVDLIPALVLAGWLLLGGVAVQDMLRRNRVNVPLFATALLMLMASTLLQTGMGALRLAGPTSSVTIMAVWSLAGIASACVFAKTRRHRLRRMLGGLRAADWMLIGGMAATVNLYLLAALLPETSSDAMRCWIPLLKYYQANGGHIPQRWFDFSLYSPAFTDLLSLPYLPFGETGTRLFIVLLGIPFMGSLVDIFRKMTHGRTMGLVVAMVMLCLPMLHWIWYCAQHDAPAFVYSMAGCALAVHYLVNGHLKTRAQSRTRLVLGALLLGFACAGKLTSVPFCAGIGSAIVLFKLYDGWRKDSDRAGALGDIALFGVCLAVLLIPYWGQVFYWTGDPMFPMFSVFKSVSEAAGGYNFVEAPWCRTIRGWVLAPYNLTFNSRLIVDVYWNGSFGPWLWMFFPFLPMALLKPNRSRVAMTTIVAIAFVLTFAIKTYYVRYNYPQYVGLLSLLGAGFFLSMREALDWRKPGGAPALAASFALVSAVLLLTTAYGFSTGFNFRNLPAFLKSNGDRQAVVESYWPGFPEVQHVCDSLPADATIAVLRTDDEPLGDLPRLAFEFRRDSTRFVTESQDTQASMDLLASAKPSAILTQGKFGGWPKDDGWRDAKRLILAGKYYMLLTDDSLIDPHQAVTIPRVTRPDVVASAGALCWSSRPISTTEVEYALEVPVPESMTAVSSVVKATAGNMIWEMIGRDGFVMPLRGMIEAPVTIGEPDIYTPNTALAPNECFYYVRQGINPGTEKIRIRFNHDRESDPPLVSGKIALFPKSRFPVQTYIPAVPIINLSRSWHIDAESINHSWYRHGSTAASTDHDASQGVPVNSNHWLAWRFKPEKCDQILVALDMSSTSDQNLAIDLRVERDAKLGENIVSSERHDVPIKGMRAIAYTRFACPNFDPASDTLTVIVWPQTLNDARVWGGRISLVNNTFVDPAGLDKSR